MFTSYPNLSVAGFENCGVLIIKYSIDIPKDSQPLQDFTHPHPGRLYKIQGFPRSALLPDNEKGRKVLDLFITAFQRRLTFTIGKSKTTQEEDCVIWGEISHKTSTDGLYGYPDPSYLDRTIEQLAAMGIYC